MTVLLAGAYFMYRCALWLDVMLSGNGWLENRICMEFYEISEPTSI